MKKISRRHFILSASATTVGSILTHGCTDTNTNTSTNTAATISAPEINTNTALETTTARLGFIALTDCAPLVIAKVKGYFQKYGVTNVEVVKQPSWSSIRDNIELGGTDGGIDGAHVLSPIPYLMSTGKITSGNRKIPMYILARLNLNGQGISVANTYKELEIRLKSASLKTTIAQAKASKKGFKYAVTFPGGTHDLWMRYWLASGGIDPDKEAQQLVIPPPQMVVNMKTGYMDVFCAGEPWNAQLVNEGVGYSALTTGEIWQNHPEKAFTMRADWVDKNPNATKAILMAIQAAQIWCDKPENKNEMAKIVADSQWINTSVNNILERARGNFDLGNGRVLKNSPHRMKFWANNASYPYKSHDLWFVTENIRWGYLPLDTDAKQLVNAVNREDIWKEAATALGVTEAIPKSSSRGIETFFDGVKFDPENPTTYLNSLQIKADIERSLDETVGN